MSYMYTTTCNSSIMFRYIFNAIYCVLLHEIEILWNWEIFQNAHFLWFFCMSSKFQSFCKSLEELTCTSTTSSLNWKSGLLLLLPALHVLLLICHTAMINMLDITYILQFTKNVILFKKCKMCYFLKMFALIARRTSVCLSVFVCFGTKSVLKHNNKRRFCQCIVRMTHSFILCCATIVCLCLYISEKR